MWDQEEKAEGKAILDYTFYEYLQSAAPLCPRMPQ